ncbi:MAG: ROK family protein [Clostridia bacterium]|nr:ROK family protein [Clostridia bacterium]
MYYLGIDLGGTNIAAGIVDENYNILKKGSVPTLASRPIDEVMTDMANLCKNLLAEMNLTVDDVEYAGIASPGTCNSETGVVEFSNNIVMYNYPIADVLKAKLGVKKVYIDNDANAAALAEALAGAAKGASSAIMITLGTGVGGGIVVDGKIYSGFNHAGAELGHIVIEKGGRQCTCGRRGCFETYSSATGLINMTKEKMEKNPDSLMWKLSEAAGKVSGKTAFQAKRQGDAAGAEVVDEYIEYLALGLTNIVNIFQPEVLCIGGGICNEGEYLMAPIREIVAKENFAHNSPNQTVIKRAALGNDAGILGAAVLGM